MQELRSPTQRASSALLPPSEGRHEHACCEYAPEVGCVVETVGEGDVSHRPVRGPCVRKQPSGSGHPFVVGAALVLCRHVRGGHHRRGPARRRPDRHAELALGLFHQRPGGLAVLAGTGALAEGQRNTGRIDTPGAVSGTGAMVALAYGITRGGEHGWGDAVIASAPLLAAVLAVLFLWLQNRRPHPMLPLRLLREAPYPFSAALPTRSLPSGGGVSLARSEAGPTRPGVEPPDAPRTGRFSVRWSSLL